MNKNLLLFELDDEVQEGAAAEGLDTATSDEKSSGASSTKKTTKKATKKKATKKKSSQPRAKRKRKTAKSRDRRERLLIGDAADAPEDDSANEVLADGPTVNEASVETKAIAEQPAVEASEQEVPASETAPSDEAPVDLALPTESLTATANLPVIKNEIIRASAGTGKTYQLTSRYLRLLLLGASPESILATTFTRKAAGEILDRIVTWLSNAATDAKTLKQLANAVQIPSLSQADCQLKLVQLTRQMHRLQIHTIDAFFMQMAMSFSLELGMTPGWSILEEGGPESNTLRNEAIAGILREESLEDLLVLVHQLSPKGEMRRGLEGMLIGRVNDAYRLFRESASDAWEKLKVPPPLSDDALAEVRDELNEYVDEKKRKQLTAAKSQDVTRIIEENWRGFFAGGKTLVRAINEGKEKYGNAKLPPDLIAIYKRFLPHLRSMILHSASSQTKATHKFLDKFNTQYRAAKEAQRLYGFDEVTEMLAKQTEADNLARISFRMDTGIEHLLLDEFQDTSIPQWRAFAKLAERCTSGEPGRSFFCVGDVKQAIYGWRGGSSEIFDLLDEKLPNLQRSELQDSRRSSPIVIDAVNRVFELLPKWDDAKLSRAKRAAQKWNFPEHSTHRRELPGHFTIETSDEVHGYTKDVQEAAVFRRAAERVAALSKQAPGRSIGVLCRRNNKVAQMMNELQRLGVPASEEGGNYLTDSASVDLVLSLLHLTDHPGDSVAAYHLASSPWGAELGLRLGECPVLHSNAGSEVTPQSSAESLHSPSGRVGLSGPERVKREQVLNSHSSLELPDDSKSDSQSTSNAAFPSPLDSSRPSRGEGEVRAGEVSQAEPRGRDPYRPAAGIDPRKISALVKRIRRLLLDDGFGDTIQGLAMQLRRFCNRREARRLTQLVEKAYEYQHRVESPTQMGYERQRRTSIRPTEFVRFIRETKVTDPSNATIRVMTVHQAKGLEFDIVVLPDLLGPFVEGHDTFLYRRPSIESDIDLVCRYMGKDSGRSFLPNEFLPLFDEFEDRKARESFCVLYVAMTRAVHALHVFLPAGMQTMKSSKGHAGYLIKDAFAPGVKLEPAKTMFEMGDRHWFQNDPDFKAPLAAELPATPKPRLAKSKPQSRHFETLAPSQLGSDRFVRLGSRLTRPDNSAKDYGTVIHLWLSRVKWSNAGLPTDAVLRDLAAPYAKQVDVDEALAKFKLMVTSEPLANILDQDQYVTDLRATTPSLPTDFDVEVRLEQRVAGKDQNQIFTGIVDRLIMVRSGGKLVAAEIIDFKTETTSAAGETTEKQERYETQMSAYRRIVASSLCIDIDSVTSRLVYL